VTPEQDKKGSPFLFFYLPAARTFRVSPYGTSFFFESSPPPPGAIASFTLKTFAPDLRKAASTHTRFSTNAQKSLPPPRFFFFGKSFIFPRLPSFLVMRIFLNDLSPPSRMRGTFLFFPPQRQHIRTLFRGTPLQSLVFILLPKNTFHQDVHIPPFRS